MAVIEMNGITKIYNKEKANECRALEDVTLSVEEGEWIAITGKSGSGKSTFLHIAGLVDGYTAGSLKFDGICMDKMKQNAVAKIRQEKVGFILQDFGLIWGMTVFDNIATPLYLSGVRRRERKQLVQEIAGQVGIADLLKKKARELSGGQCQRVAIARAVVHKPKVVFADEPTGALDRANAAQVMKLLHDVNERGTTILMVTHDMELAKAGNRMVEIVDGKLFPEL